ncbi:cupin domain-containing protein [Kordiimonas lipolytica]|uniref:Cupin domain-containing protein n=1 Tax=Kordiimonas lipolytica TaxID=1662421 RepID=A0ABV8UBP1_9PROT|nr:cupin domain-containing protein [Kordiimonas lipolytica]
MAGVSIVSFDSVTPEREEGLPDSSKLISGTPLQVTENVFEGASGKFFTGYWSSAAGKWHVNYDGEEEFCHILEGEIELTSEDGDTQRFKAGDKFVVPAGFKGTWETIEPCKKLYVIALVG